MRTIQFGAETVHALRKIQGLQNIPIAWAACGAAKEVSQCEVNEDETNTLPVTCGTCLRSKWYRKEVANDPQTGSDASP